MLEHDDLHQLICKEPVQLQGKIGTSWRGKLWRRLRKRKRSIKGGRVNERKRNHEEEGGKMRGRKREARGENRVKQEYLLMKDELEHGLA